MHLLHNGPNLCVCMLRKSHGLPCVHEMLKYSNSGIPISIIHNYWRTLDMETRVKEESLDEESLIHDEIDELFDHIKNKGLEVKKRFVEKLKEVAIPCDTELNEPPVKRRRGRPKKDSTTRDPSAFEYIDKKFQAGRDRGRSRPHKVPKSSGPKNNISNSSPK
ncbi:hypothetical protein LIER_27377 [Lithospermum erythrorhizon]|uniref:SWIM-type domain-containing protein n=1 Tax=Lithospermum erythrorhizon TaxID=34254 RepID=A0AAV3RD05_LITER